jgi:hypothetical protein
MLRRISARRLFAAGLMVAMLAAVAPATSLAVNGGGGPGPSHTVSR